MICYVKRCNMKVLITIILHFQLSYAFENLLILRNTETYRTYLICASKDDGNALVWNMPLIYSIYWNQNFDFCTTNHPNENCMKESYNDCPFHLHRNCTWNMNQWHFTDSWNKPMGPVLDNRWERFWEFDNFKYYDKKNKFNRLLRLNKTDSIVFSVRAAADVHTAICFDTNYQSSFCYWIIIGGWENTKSIIRKCPQGLPSEYPLSGSDCSIMRDNNTDFKLNPNEWKHFVLKWNNITRKITLYNKQKILLEYVDEKPVPNNHNNYTLFYKSSQPMLIRYHLYDYIYTNELNAVITSPKIPYKNSFLCFEFSIGLCENCKINITMISFNDDDVNKEINTRIIKGYKEIHELTTWQYVQINTTFSSNDYKYVKIQITPMIDDKNDQGFWAIGNIRECPSLDATKRSNIIVYALNKKSFDPSQHNVYCEKMSYERNQIVNAFQKTLKFENNDFDCPNGTLCSKSCGDISQYFNKNCKNTVICTKMGCTCYNGLTGDQCEKPCDSNRYGYACKENCGQCLTQPCDSVTGICKDFQCKNKEKYYVSPYCKTVIDVPSPPIIKFINKTYVSVSLIARDEYKETITEYCFRIRNNRNRLNENNCTYKTVFQNTTTLESDFKFLEPGINYSISCNLRVGQGKFIIKGLTNNFTTPCNVKARFKIETNDTYLTITDDNLLKNNEEIKYSCPWSWYNLLIYQNNNTNNKIYEGNIIEIPMIHKVLPATFYDVKISQNNTNILSKSILTNDGEPSEVTDVQINIQSDDQVYIEWKPPDRPNGKIQTYEITLMVDFYYGCKNYDQSIVSKYNKTTYTNTTNITFSNIPAYANYTLKIVAYNSKKGLEIEKGFVMKDTDIPRSKLSNLKYENNRITWDKPIDCTTISGSIEKTKLIFTNISDAVKNKNEIIEQTDQLYFNLDMINLNSYKKYKVEIFPIRDYLKPHNNSAGVELIFITPSKPPTSVRELDIYEFDNRTMTISLRWKEPLPPNGELDYYIVNKRYNNPHFSSISDPENTCIHANEFCVLWENYICSKIVLTKNIYSIITVTGYNKNVSSPGESSTITYNPKKFATKSDPPKNLQIKIGHKGIIILSWCHPWKTNTPLIKFFIKVQIIKSNLREYNSKSEQDKSYNYKITKYQREYEWSIKLLSSTTYKIRVQAVTIDQEESESTSGTIRTPNSISFENDKLNYTVESNSSLLLKIPRLLNDVKNSKIFIIVKGQHPCKKYTKLNKYFNELTNIKNNEIAWLAACFPADQYSGKEFSIGDNQKYEEGINCPLRSYNVYTIYVIVQAENITSILSLTLNRFVYVTNSYVIWPIYLVVIVIVLFFLGFNIHRRYNGTNFMTNIFALNEIVETNENVPKIKPTSPIVSKKRSSINQNRENLSCLINTTQNDNSTVMPIKVKDFEDYVRNAIKSGLLDEQYESFPRGQTKSWDYGKLPQNKSKNRYGNLTAYDETRVVLKKLADDPFSDYINANYIKGYKKEKRYIATQGPKANTIIDFWRMIWQESVLVICMLTNLIENGKTKCEQYWPDIGKKKTYGDVMVFNSTQNIFADYTFRILHVTCNDETRKVEHLHYTAWPDHGVPNYTHSVVTFLKKILAKEIGNGPMVVHCSAGIGRTGTIILCDICLRRVAAEGVVDVFSEMQSIRNERADMVDNKQQYLFVHLVLIDCLLSLPTSLPCNDALPTKIKNLKKNLEIQFQRLQDTAWQNEALRPPVSQTSLSESNLAKNRYPELVSNKINRVFLKRYPPHDEESDYIAAVYVDGFKEQNQYLSSQLPMPTTFGDFWRMIAELNIELIVVLQPPDPEDPTCCPLVPTNNEFKPTPYINVITKELSETEYYVSNKLMLIDNSEKPSKEQPVTILTCKQWEAGKNKDPPSAIALVTLWQAACRVARINSPTAVLCHDGVTGCGIYLAMSFLLERMAIERECDICLAIRTVKQFRPDFVRTVKDMEYLYDAALAYMKYFETYANFS